MFEFGGCDSLSYLSLGVKYGNFIQKIVWIYDYKAWLNKINESKHLGVLISLKS